MTTRTASIVHSSLDKQSGPVFDGVPRCRLQHMNRREAREESRIVSWRERYTCVSSRSCREAIERGHDELAKLVAPVREALRSRLDEVPHIRSFHRLEILGNGKL